MIRYQKQNFVDGETVLSAMNLKKIEDGISNLEDEIISINGSVDMSPNLFLLNDPDVIDALFENPQYIEGDGKAKPENQSFAVTYSASDKIYINGNEGAFTLPLESGKTYRWQCIPKYEFGNIKMSAPWGTDTYPGSFSSKRYWFYDGDDNLIENSSIGSKNDVHMMTIPEGAVYMRFMCCGYGNYASNIKNVLQKQLMVTEGTDVYEEYIKPGKIIIEQPLDKHNVYCDFSNERCSIVYHYSDTHDMLVTLLRKGPNHIVDISGFSLLPVNPNGDIQTNLSEGKQSVCNWGSDFHGPFAGLIAVNNPLNNLGPDINGVTPPGFTGGNHGYKNTGASITADPQNTPTGRSGIFRVFADGVELKTDGIGKYCNKVDIYWENFVQAGNTVLPDGSGREVLKEIHEVCFTNGKFTEEVKLIPLENLKLNVYYGIQGMTIQTTFGDSIYYGGSREYNTVKKIHATSVNADSCCADAWQSICTGPEHTLFMEVDPTYGMGSRYAYTVKKENFPTLPDSDFSSIKCAAGQKLYFQLVRAVGGWPMNCGEVYCYRCSYGVRPTQNKFAVRALNLNLTNVTLKSGADIAWVDSNNYLYFTANENFELPDDITVTNADYTWNKTNGELIIFNVTADVKTKVDITISSTN